jgi:hypothetical protein
VDTLHLCVDGLMYGANAAIMLLLFKEQEVFSRLLAKVLACKFS